MMSRKMRYLKIMNTVNPLCVAYLGYFSQIMYHLVDTYSASPKTAQLKIYSNIAKSFKDIQPSVILEEIILEGKEMDGDKFIREGMRGYPGLYDSGSVSINYLPTFVVFCDARSNVEPMSLPVELTLDEIHVEIKIHYPHVDEYVKGLISYNNGSCRVFISSSHVAYVDYGHEVRWNDPKKLSTVVHVDNTTETLLT